MKTSFITIASIVLGASMVLGAAHPAPTPHHHHMAKRAKSDDFDGIDFSSLLANPSAYIKQFSASVNKHENFAQAYASMTANPAFEKSMSKELVDIFGTKTAKQALAQYTNAIANLAQQGGSSAQGADAAGSAAAAVATSALTGNNADAAAGAQVAAAASAVTSGASDLVAPAGMIALAFAAGTGALVAIL